MPWKGVTVSEQRQRFIEDYLLNFYSKTELAERFGVSLWEGYGLTETAPVLCVGTHAAHRDGTVGKPIPLDDALQQLSDEAKTSTA